MSALEGLTRIVLEFVETSVPGAEYLLRGFPRGSLIVVRGALGTGKTVFAATFLYESAMRYGGYTPPSGRIGKSFMCS